MSFDTGSRDDDGHLFEAADVKRAANDGAKGSSPLPYLERMQAAFGDHDLSSIRCQIGGAGADACDAIGAESYATGDRIAFKSAPSEWLVAHEVAHVVQQRQGASVAGGVGEVGDSHEQHADAIADAIVGGRSIVDLLGGQSAGTSAAGDQVQCYKERKKSKNS